MRAVVAKHQVGSSAVQQQVRRLEGQGEALDALTEVKGVPQVVVGGVYEKVLKKRGTRTLAHKKDFPLMHCTTLVE